MSDVRVLTLSWSTSRGQDTYGWNICRLDDTTTGKRYRCNGGGYDMVGSVFADWLEDVHQAELVTIQHRAAVIYPGKGASCVRNESPDALYGMHVAGSGVVRLDGACGFESIRRVAEALGYTVRTLTSKRGRVTGFVVERAA